MAILANFANIVAPIYRRAQADPSDVALVFIHADQTEQLITVGELVVEARRWATLLQRSGVHANDVVALALPQDPALIFAFWGALWLGATPTIQPFFTPRSSVEEYAAQINLLMEANQIAVIVVTPELMTEVGEPLLASGFQVIDGAAIRTIVDIDVAADSAESYPNNTIAFLQFSSGTTGAKKGVPISHRRILNHVEIVSDTFRLTDANVVVCTWLPLYHDMGLIGGFLAPLLLGNKIVMMSPFDWAMNPKSLIWAIHNHRGTHCWMPNFGFDFLATMVRHNRITGVDLSCVRYLLNGAEPIRYDSLRKFYAHYGQYGLPDNVIRPAYGMAENTVAIALTPFDEEAPVEWIDRQQLQADGSVILVSDDHPNAVAMVGCGKPISDTTLSIRDDQGVSLPERTAGEIWIRGNSVFDGYYLRPDLSAEAFSDGWFKTGDLGYLSQGHVFITGRKKDLIIIGGKNFYPEDIEAIVEQLPFVRNGRVAAFAIEDSTHGTEGAVVVVETRNSAESADNDQQLIQKHIQDHIGIRMSDVRFVPRHWIVKSSSGKVSRFANRAKYLDEFINAD